MVLVEILQTYWWKGTYKGSNLQNPGQIKELNCKWTSAHAEVERKTFAREKFHLLNTNGKNYEKVHCSFILYCLVF